MPRRLNTRKTGWARAFALAAGLAASAVAASSVATAEGGLTLRDARCPDGSPAGGPGTLRCSYERITHFEPSHVGGPWQNIDLLSATLDDLAKIRDGKPTTYVYPNGPAVPPLKLVHAQVCLSDPYVPYNRCPNNYPRNRAAQTFGYELNPEVITRLEQGLDRLRKSGLKVILRFTYNWPCEGGQRPPRCNGGVNDDAPIAVIRDHMRKLAPTIQANSDVIFILQAGFIGRWGEWHNSTRGNDAPGPRNAFLDEYRHLFEGYTNLEVRRSSYVLDYADYLAARNRPSNYMTLGLGMHNDEFGSDENDGGTFEPAPGYYSPCDLRRAAQKLGRRYTTTGETTKVYKFNERPSCAPGVANPGNYPSYAAAYGLSTLQLGGFPKVFRYWMRQGIYHGVLKKVGPHLAVTTATLRLRPTGRASLSLTIENTGWAKIPNRLPAYLVLRRDGVTVMTRKLAFDLADVPAGGTLTRRLDLGSWAALPAGRYEAFLAAPDRAPSLAADPRYAFYFETVGTAHRDSGLNKLGAFTLGR